MITCTDMQVQASPVLREKIEGGPPVYAADYLFSHRGQSGGRSVTSSDGWRAKSMFFEHWQ